MHNVSYQMSSDLERDVEREMTSFETEEPGESGEYSNYEIDQIESSNLESGEYSNYEIDQIESSNLESGEYSSFEIDEELSKERELDDPDLMRFMPSMYELFLQQGETGFDEASETLARDMTQYWFSWKKMKNKLKKA